MVMVTMGPPETLVVERRPRGSISMQTNTAEDQLVEDLKGRRRHVRLNGGRGGQFRHGREGRGRNSRIRLPGGGSHSAGCIRNHGSESEQKLLHCKDP